MEMIIRVKGITKRWIFNVLLVVISLVVLLELALGIIIHNYYYNAVTSASYFERSSLSSFFVQYANATRSEFEQGALQFVEAFDAKEKMEIQILDQNGRIILSSAGFVPDTKVAPDYERAKADPDGKGQWQGENENGEKIFAHTTLMPKTKGGTSIGAVRYLVSLREVDRQISFSMVALFLIGLALISFSLFSGMYFINSIVKPVGEISRTAKKIAMGDFNSRLEVRDNDEIGELCDTINYMAGELAAAEQMKNDFVSSVSHELRTPLTAIKGWGETIKDAVFGETEADREIVKKGMEVIIGESERLAGLVEDLLDFSRMQSGRLSIKHEPVDVLAELGEAVYMFEEAAKRAEIELSYIEPANLSPVTGDANRMKQVFINIIDNAIKYTPPGGQVLVEASESDGFVKIRVLDTGCGIPFEDLDKVKNKFYKSNKTVRGSGIGLAVADEIVKLHNGMLFIDSQEGAGTAVTILFPAKQRSEEDVLDAASLQASQTKQQEHKESEPDAQNPVEE